MIRAIIFDCFGVILTDAMQLLRAEVQQDNPDTAREITDIISANNHGFIQPTESNERIAKLLGISVDALRARVAGSEVRDERLLQYIQDIHKTYKTALLSNIAGSSLAKRFPNNELKQYFDEIIASGDIGYAKPEPEAYEIAAKRLGVRNEECVFTDDREVFCMGSTSVGMHTIVYTDFVQFRRELEALLLRENS